MPVELVANRLHFDIDALALKARNCRPDNDFAVDHNAALPQISLQVRLNLIRQALLILWLVAWRFVPQPKNCRGLTAKHFLKPL